MAAHCAVCGTVPTTYLTNEFGQRACLRHRQPAACWWCMRYLPEHQLTDVCATCSTTAITDHRVLAFHASLVLAWLAQYFPGHQLQAVDLELVDRASLDLGQRGRTDFVIQGINARCCVRLPSGIPATLAQEVLAHEFGHVVLTIDPITLTSAGRVTSSADQREEGFCELLRWNWIEQNVFVDRDTRLRSVTTNEVDLYRNGYIEMKAELDRFGSIAALRDAMLGLEASAAVDSWPPPPPPPVGDPSTTTGVEPPVPPRPRLRPTITMSDRPTSPVPAPVVKPSRPIIDVSQRPSRG